MSGGSWITKPGWQVAVGLSIMLCIVAAGFSSMYVSQQAIDSGNDETVERVVCANWSFVVKQTQPPDTAGETRPERLAVLAEVARQRTIARQKYADEQPIDVRSVCAPVSKLVKPITGGR